MNEMITQGRGPGGHSMFAISYYNQTSLKSTYNITPKEGMCFRELSPMTVACICGAN